MEQKSIAEAFQDIATLLKDSEGMAIGKVVGKLIDVTIWQQELIEQQEKRIARLESSPGQMSYGSL